MKIKTLRGLREKLFILIVGVVLVFGLFTTLIGTSFIQTMTLREAQTRVKNNLGGAGAVLQAEIDSVHQTIAWIGTKDTIIQGYKKNSIAHLRERLKQIKHDSHIDFLTLTDRRGVTILRATNTNASGDDVSGDFFVRSALTGETVKGMLLMPPQRLDLEGDTLSHKAFIPLKPTPHAKPRWQTEERRGMVIVASSSIRDENGVILGTVYGGLLLNRNYRLVDKINSVVFGDEAYGGQRVGTVTLFQWDTRIATNVMDEKGQRAIGTRVSEEVYDRTLENGMPWHGRAFVVKDWYISAYEPIKDFQGEIIGMLYVGALEQKYQDMKTQLFLVFNSFSLLWILVVLILSTQISKRFITPIHNLALAAQKVSSGSWDVQIPEFKGRNEIGELTEAFHKMMAAIREREEALMRVNLNLAATNKNYMEMLSFVSHELKNQIAGSAIAVRTVQRNAAGTLQEGDMRLLDKLSDTMIYLGEILKNYLDLSRLESGEFVISKKNLSFVADVILPTLDRLSVWIDRKDILIKNLNDPSVSIHSDPALLSVIFYNLLHNAIRHSPQGEVVKLASRLHDDYFEFEVQNRGTGIPKEEQARVFDKFYRGGRESAHYPHGTGLGLYITRILVEMLGGSIWVESENEKWTAFYVKIPQG